MSERIIGQVRWPNEIMWTDEQKAKGGWLAIVSNYELQEMEHELEALRKENAKFRAKQHIHHGVDGENNKQI